MSRAPQPGRTDTDERGGDLLPARRVHPPDGQAVGLAGDHDAVEVPGVGDGQRARLPRGGVPHTLPDRRRAVRQASSVSLMREATLRVVI